MIQEFCKLVTEHNNTKFQALTSSIHTYAPFRLDGSLHQMSNLKSIILGIKSKDLFQILTRRMPLNFPSKNFRQLRVQFLSYLKPYALQLLVSSPTLRNRKKLVRLVEIENKCDFLSSLNKKIKILINMKFSRMNTKLWTILNRYYVSLAKVEAIFNVLMDEGESK